MSDDRTPRLTRRGFLAGTIVAALVACSDDGSGSSPSTAARPADTSATTATTADTAPAPSASPETTADTPNAITSDPFTLGVASGDPLADSVILWTRLVQLIPRPTRSPTRTSRCRGRSPATTSSPMWSAAAPRSPSRRSGTPSTSTSTGLDPDSEYHYRFSIGEFSTPPAAPARFAAPRHAARSLPVRASRRARTGSRATTPPTATWSSRATSMPSSSSATTSTSTRAAATPIGAAAQTGQRRRVRDGRAVPRPLRALQGPTRCLQAAHAPVPVDRHVGRPRGRQRLRRRHLRAGRRAVGGVPSRSAPPPTRRGTSTCRCGSTRPTAPTYTIYRSSRLRRPRALPRARHPPVPLRPAAWHAVRGAVGRGRPGPRRRTGIRSRPHDARHGAANVADRRRRDVDRCVGRARGAGLHVRRQRRRRCHTTRGGGRHLGRLRGRTPDGARARWAPPPTT